jgi:hypothetical protein
MTRNARRRPLFFVFPQAATNYLTFALNSFMNLRFLTVRYSAPLPELPRADCIFARALSIDGVIVDVVKIWNSSVFGLKPFGNTLYSDRFHSVEIFVVQETTGAADFDWIAECFAALIRYFAWRQYALLIDRRPTAGGWLRGCRCSFCGSVEQRIQKCVHVESRQKAGFVVLPIVFVKVLVVVQNTVEQAE